MSRQIILQSTLDVIDHVLLIISRYDNLRARDYYYARLNRRGGVTLDHVRQRLYFLNEYLSHFEELEFEKVFEGERPLDWLFYEEHEEVIPVYNEALAIVSRRLIVAPSQIPNLIAFMGIPKTKTGIDVENHDGKGYHFHYGEVKRDKLKRYNVLLTFNKMDVNDQIQMPNIPLYVEPHASGKCLDIDASTIGHNRRLPIYLVCQKAMSSRGIENFLVPSADSWVFYSDS
jgi:hypothetical protein